MPINAIKELFQRSDSSGSKSTVLKPLTWFISIIIGGLILLIKIDAPLWVVIMFSIVMGIVIIVFLFSYLYCLFTDRDAIRSEKYSIQKMAIEKGLYGDNITGLFPANDRKELRNGKKVSNNSEEEKI
ncbi:MAG: hypothetical protein NTW49_02790 [Bacteroidia bacterium]|nr:hypothetical protein [Bacteroidia bacterium]